MSFGAILIIVYIHNKKQQTSLRKNTQNNGNDSCNPKEEQHQQKIDKQKNTYIKNKQKNIYKRLHKQAKNDDSYMNNQQNINKQKKRHTNNKQTDKEQKQTDTEQKQTDTELKQTDTEQKA